ncbi:MAG: coniferyl aldehyde dehydrogenase [Pseudomonadota bacterium]
MTELRDILDAQRKAFASQASPDLGTRLARLDAILSAITRDMDVIVSAMKEDFGSRSVHEILMAELFTTVSGIRHIKKHLAGWMEPEKRAVPLVLQRGRARLMRQPLGVVGVIAPWNYPFYLAILPMATALAAGNRVMLKPSELTPRTSDCMAGLLAGIFPQDLVATVIGGAEVGAAFSALPFDHLFFTGSTAVGKKVMAAASENLTPVTLELGGKSPALVTPDYPLEKAVHRICAGKFFNAGQTCVAPDSVLVPAGREEAFAGLAEAVIKKSYPALADNPDYTAIINQGHYNRLLALTRDAETKGARVISVNPAGETLAPEGRRMAPTLVLNPDDSMGVMNEEIFGPILPVEGYADLDEALAKINARPRPLAFYVFDEDERRVERILAGTTSGGVCVNETMLQVAADDLPFGGVGASGMGSYHAREGFLAFSHSRGVFYQDRINPRSLFGPPYTKALERLLTLLVKRGTGLWPR